jgi:hypothetical protein
MEEKEDDFHGCKLPGCASKLQVDKLKLLCHCIPSESLTPMTDAGDRWLIAVFLVRVEQFPLQVQCQAFVQSLLSHDFIKAAGALTVLATSTTWRFRITKFSLHQRVGESDNSQPPQSSAKF